MTSVRKRKMARSSVKKNTKHVKDKKRDVKMTAHPVMQAHWDKKLTLKQNYKRLGLTARLGHATGGEEATVTTVSEYRASKEAEGPQAPSPESIATETDPEKIPLGEARLIRDPETNEVVQVIYGKMEVAAKKETANPTSIIDELIKYNEEHAKPPRNITTTAREDAWLAKLEEKYGDDFEKMKWDKKLNPTFMSAGQLRKKMALYHKNH